MSNVYEKKPNIVEVTVKDESGEEVRHIVGYSLSEVVEAVVLSLDGAEPKVVVKARKPRGPNKKKVSAAASAPATVVAKGQESADPEPERKPAWA